ALLRQRWLHGGENQEQRRGWIVEEKIAECATRIWTLLEQTSEVNILRLSELLGERNVVAYQALGWLARDKKIHYEQKGSQVFISRSLGGRRAS
ncbi:MAG TPA: winged helix-turn-helix domain-containing protein, partial [Spirochaetia bacterium]|nr:winged helix-turn-helix domain-containing protein [Spirochaetia bacterium]